MCIRDSLGGDADTREVMTLWADVLTRLGSDPMSCARELDWVAKLRLLQAYRDRDGLAWTEPRLAALDIQWSDIRPNKSVFAKLRAAGQVTDCLLYTSPSPRDRTRYRMPSSA